MSRLGSIYSPIAPDALPANTPDYSSTSPVDGSIDWTAISANLSTAAIAEVQATRAKQGLPPLSLSQYSIPVTVDASQQTQQYIYIGLGLLAVFALLG